MSVMVAMSGGVDSSVAAALLVQAHGIDAVVGVTLQLQAACGGQDSIAAAREVALALGISHHVLDLHQAFEQQVLRPAWSDYSQGRTPNPCVLCNATIKFGLLQEHGRRLGATLLATGHYARIETLPDGRTGLFRGQDPDKDQSYFLFALSPAQLAATTLPVGHLTKGAVRATARELGLPNWDMPSAACLSSRIPYGARIDVEILSQVAQAESQLKQMGFRQVRVRHHDQVARIEVPPDDFPALLAGREQIIERLKSLGYTYVTLDLAGFRSGSLNELLPRHGR